MILITGGGGLLGSYLIEAFPGQQVVVMNRGMHDLTRKDDVKRLMECKPEVIIHAAGMTNVDECENRPLEAVAQNRDSTMNLVTQMHPGGKFVYISTDMVYPDTMGPHLEHDVGPINAYGRSKLAGERAAAVNARHLIIRTNFFGPSRVEGRRSFSDWAIESLTNGHTPLFFTDVFWSPLHMKTLSTLIRTLVDKDAVGIYNVGASGPAMSKAAFVQHLAFHKGLLEQFNKAALGPSSFKTQRPHDLSMDVTKLMKLGILTPSIVGEIAKL